MRKDRRDDIVFQAKGRLTKLFNLRAGVVEDFNKVTGFIEEQAEKLRKAGMKVEATIGPVILEGPAPERDWHDAFGCNVGLKLSGDDHDRYVMRLRFDIHRKKKWLLNLKVSVMRADAENKLDNHAPGTVLDFDYFEPENQVGIERFITRKLASVAAHMVHTQNPETLPKRPQRKRQKTSAPAAKR